jgi:lambda family phage minor tail protein L
MAQTLTATYITEKNKMEGARLFAIEYGDAAASWLYFAAWNKNVDYFQPGTATAQTYTPAPIEVSQMERGGIDETPGLNLSISNVDRTVIAYLELYDALRGRAVKIIRTFDSMLSDSNANVTETYYVDGGSTTAQKAQLRLVPRTVFYQIKTPSRAFRRNQCQWEFKSLYCAGAATLTAPYVNASLANASFTTCLKTLASCDAYVNASRYGGFPGIPKQRIYIS